jgi:hypothetical protein
MGIPVTAAALAGVMSRPAAAACTGGAKPMIVPIRGTIAESTRWNGAIADLLAFIEA